MTAYRNGLTGAAAAWPVRKQRQRLDETRFESWQHEQCVRIADSGSKCRGLQLLWAVIPSNIQRTMFLWYQERMPSTQESIYAMLKDASSVVLMLLNEGTTYPCTFSRLLFQHFREWRLMKEEDLCLNSGTHHWCLISFTMGTWGRLLALFW